MPHFIGKRIPNFTATAVHEDRVITDFSLARYQGRNLVFFFFPLDFSFLCPVELHDFQENLSFFEEINVDVVACTGNSQYKIQAWLELKKEKGGIAGVQYPIIADKDLSVARSLGVLNEAQGMVYRGLFFVDVEGIVRHESFNDMLICRSASEILRLIEAWQLAET
jgi:peroxiredoxin 2/4